MKAAILALLMLDPSSWLDFSAIQQRDELLAYVDSAEARQRLDYPSLRRLVLTRALPGISAQLVTPIYRNLATSSGCSNLADDASATGSWDMDDAANGTRVDASGEGNDLTDNLSSVGLDTGDKQEGTGSASYTNVTNQRLTLTDANKSASGLGKTGYAGTLYGCWIKIDSDDNPTLEWSAGNFAIDFASGPGTITATLDTTGANNRAMTSNGNWSTGTWTHVMAGYNGTTAVLYVDNVAQTDTEAASGNTDTNSGDMFLPGVPFPGHLDDCFELTRSADTDERTCIYDEGFKAGS